MAEVLPFKALHYDLRRVGSLEAVAAPPYDVIDAAQRTALLERSPHNAVAIDLPVPPGEEATADAYAAAAKRIEEWVADGALVQDEEPSLWALTQDYTAPDGSRHSRHGVLARVRVEDYESGGIRPHERTHPGPLLDRLELTRASGYNLSPIFSLASADPWPLVEPALGEPWGEVTDEDGTVNRLWKVEDKDIQGAVTELLADAQLLIADGHHRYETARAFRDEVGGEGPHDYTLMSLTGLDDPGLTVFPTHRLLALGDEDGQRRFGGGVRELFEATEVAEQEIDPAGEEGIGVFGLYDRHHRSAYRLRLTDDALAELDRRLAGKPEAYRRLDSAILETLVLEGLLGMSAEDIDERRGLEYAKSVPDALAGLEHGYDVAFVLRPVPIEQVRAVAETDENMPPKSTYFFPKVMTGFAFNPVR
jgi:uncharacterized protein (DUF1015 family)